MSSQDVFTVFDKNHSIQSLKAMKEFRQTKRFCDIKISFGEKVLYAHQMILAAFSPFFSKKIQDKEILPGENKEPGSIPMDEHTTFECMVIILEYMYSGNLTFPLDYQQCQTLLRTLDLFEMPALRQKTEKLLVENISLDNCLVIVKLLGEAFDVASKNLALQFIDTKFDLLKDSTSFKELDFEHVNLILSEAKLCTTYLLYDAAINWLKYSDKRKIYLKQILDLIPFQKMTPQFIRDRVTQEELIKNDSVGREWLVENLLISRNSTMFQNIRSLYCFSNDSPGRLFEVNIEQKKIRLLEKTPQMFTISATRCQNNIYLAGTEESSNNTFRRYDLINDNWKELLPTGIRKCSRLCSISDRLYFVGGETLTRSCSAFDVNTNQWSELSSLKYERQRPGVVNYGSCIYVLGGYDNQSSFVEYMDPRVGRWKTRSIPICGSCSAAIISNQIFCLTKIYTSNTFKLIQFDIRKWDYSEVYTASTLTEGHDLAAIDGRLFLANPEGISEYNWHENTWNSFIELPLTNPELIA